MYKVLIVDDEMLVRVGLKTTIDWESIGFEVVGEASNGEQGFAQYKKHKPDIIITDIKMPKKDGIWLIEEIRKESKSAKILVLTCYDEFSIVRKALKAGADDYILKLEAEDEELMKVMESIKSKIDESSVVVKAQSKTKSNQNAIKRSLLNDMIKVDFVMDEKIVERCVALEFNIMSSKFAFASIAINEETINNKSQESSLRQINNAIVNIIFDQFSDRNINYIYNNYMNKYVFMLSFKEIDELELRRNFVLINSAVKQYFDISLNVIYSDIFNCVETCFDVYKSLIKKSEVRFYNNILECEVLNTSSIKFKEVDVFDLKKNYNSTFSEYVGREKKVEAIELINETSNFFNLENVSPMIVKIFYSNLIGEIFNNYGKLFVDSNEILEFENYHYQIEHIDRLDNLVKVLSELTFLLIAEIRNSRHKNSKVIINRAINFIENNYGKKISLEHVAEEVHLSKHYFCNVFKKETGENVSLYINKFRIEKAKKLILEDNAKIKNIYVEVGYSNQQYFSKVFKKITGMTVMEYKESKN